MLGGCSGTLQRGGLDRLTTLGDSVAFFGPARALVDQVDTSARRGAEILLLRRISIPAPTSAAAACAGCRARCGERCPRGGGALGCFQRKMLCPIRRGTIRRPQKVTGLAPEASAARTCGRSSGPHPGSSCCATPAACRLQKVRCVQRIAVRGSLRPSLAPLRFPNRTHVHRCLSAAVPFRKNTPRFNPLSDQLDGPPQDTRSGTCNPCILTGDTRNCNFPPFDCR